MYQRAVKIARILEESRKERQALGLVKRKMESFKKGFLGNKRFRSDDYQGKGKGPIEGQANPQCQTCGRYHTGACNLEVRCFRCGEPGHMKRNCPKAPKTTAKHNPLLINGGHPHLQNEGNLLQPKPTGKLRMLRSLKLEDECFA